jgi:hypothetical protein
MSYLDDEQRRVADALAQRRYPTLQAVLDAEQRLADALEAEARYLGDANGWTGRQRIGDDDRVRLDLDEAHFQRIESFAAKRRAAEQNLAATWRHITSFAGGA